AALDEAGRAERTSERARRAPAPRQLDLLGGEPARPVAVAELVERERRLRAPAEERRVPAAELLVATAQLEQVLQRLGRPTPEHPQPCSAVEEPQHVAARGEPVADAEPVERRLRAVEVAAV